MGNNFYRGLLTPYGKRLRKQYDKMKRAKVKWAACFLAAVMVGAMLPLSVFAADEPAVLIVGGVNALETSSGEGWSYQKETSTLTLNGYNGGPIHADGLSLNVVLAENSVNTITSEVSRTVLLWVQMNFLIRITI